MNELTDQVIGGRFRIIRLIGQGGMGNVYEARHLSLPNTYAVKILKGELAVDRGFIERFRREAIAMSRVDHPNVIRITDFGHTGDGSVYLVMEFLEGMGLDEVLSKQVRLPVERALIILAQVADALEVAHQVNVVHRDLKPENILLTERHGRKDFVKLLDFGIAKMRTPEFDGSPLTIQGEVFGTAEYMSPEQATGRQQDGRSDIYALGCLAYELITGEPPFLGSAVDVLRSHVFSDPSPPSSRLNSAGIIPALDALILRCLSKNPDHRYQSCAELRQDLMRVRATSFSITEKMAQKSRITGRMSLLTNDVMAQGWHSLGGKAPELLLPYRESPLVMGEAVSAPGPEPPRPLPDFKARLAVDRERLRKLAVELVRLGLAPEPLERTLDQVLALMEEQAALDGSIALSLQGAARLDLEFAQKERPLRRAVGHLRRDVQELQRRLQGAVGTQRGALELQVRDLTFQVQQLESRSEEVTLELAVQHEELEREQDTLRKDHARLDLKLGESFETIRELLVSSPMDQLPAALQAQVQSLSSPAGQDPAMHRVR